MEQDVGKWFTSLYIYMYVQISNEQPSCVELQCHRHNSLGRWQSFSLCVLTWITDYLAVLILTGAWLLSSNGWSFKISFFSHICVRRPLYMEALKAWPRCATLCFWLIKLRYICAVCVGETSAHCSTSKWWWSLSHTSIPSLLPLHHVASVTTATESSWRGVRRGAGWMWGWLGARAHPVAMAIPTEWQWQSDIIAPSLYFSAVCPFPSCSPPRAASFPSLSKICYMNFFLSHWQEEVVVPPLQEMLLPLQAGLVMSRAEVCTILSLLTLCSIHHFICL